MLLGLTYQLMRSITDLVLVRTRSDAQLRAEVLALRHQLRVLERKVGKPAWQPADRLLLAGLSRLLPKSGLPSLLPKPETLLRWHRDLVWRKLGCLPPAPSAPTPSARPRAAGADSEAGGGEAEMGLPQDSGGDGQVGFR